MTMRRFELFNNLGDVNAAAASVAREDNSIIEARY